MMQPRGQTGEPVRRLGGPVSVQSAGLRLEEQ